jgi:ribosomal protein S18 acetylase RimI-like enzyme
MTNEDRIRLSDLNLAEYLRETARWNKGGEVHEKDDLLLTMGISRFPTTSAAMNLSNAKYDDAREVWERVRSFYRERKTPFCIHIRRHADAALEALCLSEKMAVVSDSPGMITERTLPASMLPAGVEIRRIDGVEGVVDFRAITIASFESLGMPAFVGEKIFATPERLLQPHIDMVAAYDQGLPVSAAMVIHSHSIAGIYWVGTVPAARGRGLGEACVSEVANEALRRGAAFVVLQATKSGAPLYRRMGFEEITRYPWYMRQDK